MNKYILLLALILPLQGCAEILIVGYGGALGLMKVTGYNEKRGGTFDRFATCG